MAGAEAGAGSAVDVDGEGGAASASASASSASAISVGPNSGAGSPAGSTSGLRGARGLRARGAEAIGVGGSGLSEPGGDIVIGGGERGREGLCAPSSDALDVSDGVRDDEESIDGEKGESAAAGGCVKSMRGPAP
jgi:hypothetical protein